MHQPSRLLPKSCSGPSPKLGLMPAATDSLTNHLQTEKAVAPTTQSITPAPLPAIGQGDANLLSQSPQDPAPTPLPSPPSSSTQPQASSGPTLITETSKVPGREELPPVQLPRQRPQLAGSGIVCFTSIFDSQSMG